MIQANDLEVGNWISINYSGSLIKAFKVLEKNQKGVVIKDDRQRTIEMDPSEYKYKQEESTTTESFYGIKGIPLTTEILESCGFRLNENSIHTQLNTVDTITKYYSDKDAFTICYIPGKSNKFLRKL